MQAGAKTALSGKLPGQQEARPGSCSGAGPCRSAAQIEVLDRGPIVRPSRHRTQEEILVEMVAAREIVAAHQIGVFPLEIERRKDRTAEHLRAQTGRASLENVEDAIGIGFLGFVPVAGADHAERVAADFGWQHAHLHPENVLAGGRARGINGRWLPDNQSRFGRQQTC